MLYNAITEYVGGGKTRIDNIEAPDSETVTDAILEMDHPDLVSRVIVIEVK